MKTETGIMKGPDSLQGSVANRNIKRVVLAGLTVFIASLFFFTACEKTYVTQEEEVIDEDTTDYVLDTSQVVIVTLNTTSITIDPVVAKITGSVITISEAGTYRISGTLTDGQIIVNTEDETAVKLIFNGVNISCSNSAPVYIHKARKVIIFLSEGTQNYLSDGSTYILTDGEPGAALFSNAYLAISGEGALNVTANYRDAISSDDELIINSGTISVTAADDGLRGKDYLYIRNGNITVSSKGDGLVSDNSSDPAMGFIEIDTGVFRITTTDGDAISAQTNININNGDFTITTGGGAGTITGGSTGPGGGGSSGYSGTISEKGIKAGETLTIIKGTININSADDALHSGLATTVNDGSLSLATGDDAIHSDGSVTVNGGTINVTKCYEGIEAPAITINGGDLTLASVDDTFNATKGAATEANDGSLLLINGGNILLNASTGDCIDSNGNVTVTGGTVVAHGPASSPEVGADVNGTFKVTGGFVFYTGPNSGNMIETVSSSSTQNCIKATFSTTLAASTLVHIQDASGNNIVTYKTVRNVYYIVICSPDLKTGSSYSLYTGGTTTGTYSTGIYTGGTYSGGTLRKTFTLSALITNVSI